MEELKALIDSMSAREQRYFREFARRHSLKGKNKYLQLFDALVKKVDEELNFHQLPALTNYLKKLIMRALRAYHYQDSIGMELRSYLDFLEILFEKQQISLAKKTAEKGLRKAMEAGMPGLELEFSVWLRRLRRNQRPQHSDAQARVQENSENLAASALVASIQCLHVYDRVFWHAQERTLMPVQTRSKAAAELAGHPALQVAPPNSFDGAILYHTTYGVLAQLNGEFEKALAHFQENMEVWNKFPARIEAHPSRFSAAIMNYLSACHHVGRYTEGRAVLQNLQKNPRLTTRVQDHIQGKCLDLELVLALNTYQADIATAAVAGLVQFLEEKTATVHLQLSIQFNLAMYHFLQDAYSTCLRYLNAIQDAPHPQARQDLRDQSRLFELVVHFELGNLSLLPYRIRSLRRNYRKMALPGWTKAFLASMQKLARTWQAADRLPIYRKLKSDMEEEAARNVSGGALEIQLWVISKLSYQSLKEAWMDGFQAASETS